MRRYIEERRRARDYDDVLRRKVEAGRADKAAGRADKAAGRHRPHEDVEAEFAALRAAALSRTEERA